MKKIYILWCIIVVVTGCFKSVDAQSINHWEMVVAANDTWKYFPGTSEPPATWTNIDFNDVSWSSGTGGIGYADGDDGTTISQVSSVYLRIRFNLIDTSTISWALLHVDYDDAFVAFFNGHEIARANIGVIGTRPSYNSYSIVDHEAKMYQGGIPERFIIHKDTLKKYKIEGANVLAIQVHNYNATSSDLSSNTFFTIGIKDGTSTYRKVPAWFNDPLEQKTNLPLLIIDTKGQQILDEPKITASLKVVDNGPGQLNGFLDDPTDYEGNMGIEIRGQSSQMFPKKGYGIELWTKAGADTSVSLLGMPADEDWVLSAPYSDKTMMRNAISYQLGRKMGRWQPRFRYCEVYMNGSYHGVYMLIETIKRSPDRVDINKLKPDEITGDDVTGGYILKVDKIQDISSDEFFYSYPTVVFPNSRSYAFTYVVPKFDVIVPEQKAYLKSYLVLLENALNGSSFKDIDLGYRKYMDVNSFVDFQIINELANNVDGYRFSTFFYKKRESDGGKLFAGPLWDFDLCYGNVDYAPDNLATDKWLYPKYGSGEWSTMHWWARLMQDDNYQRAFSTRWNDLRAGPFSTDSIMADLDENIEYMGEAVARNFVRWPILGVYVWPNYFVGSTYDEEVDYLKTWITNRLEWMDGNVSLIRRELATGNQGFKVSVFPNPVKDKLNIRLTTQDITRIDCEIVDLMGKKVFVSDYSPASYGEQAIQFTIPPIAPGYYILKITQKHQVIGIQKLIID